MNKIFTPIPSVTTAPKCDLFISLPYNEQHSENPKAEITKVTAKYYPQLSIRVLYNNVDKIGNFFNLKQRMPFDLQSDIIYKYACGVCNDTYIGLTAKIYRFRISQQLGISHRTSRRLATVVKSAPRHHAEASDHPIFSSNFKIITKAPHTLDIRTLESLYMHTESPSLNKDKFATKLNIVM